MAATYTCPGCTAVLALEGEDAVEVELEVAGFRLEAVLQHGGAIEVAAAGLELEAVLTCPACQLPQRAEVRAA